MKRTTVVATLLFVAIIVAAGIGYAEYADIIIATKPEALKKAMVKPVMFPHWFHRIRFKCKVCHEDIFILRRGANDINMDKIMKGEYCGKCHNGQIAWEPLFCDRCHSWDGPIPPYASTYRDKQLLDTPAMVPLSAPPLATPPAAAPPAATPPAAVAPAPATTPAPAPAGK